MAKFTKGVSGNPGGRPSGVGDLREIARKHTDEAVQVLVQGMGDASAAPSARVGAASALLDRGWGRAHQSIDASINPRERSVDSGLMESMGDLLKLAKKAVEAKQAKQDALVDNRRVTETAPSVDAEGEAETVPALEVTAH